MALVGTATRNGQIVNLIAANDELTGDFSIQSLTLTNQHASSAAVVVLGNTADTTLFTFCIPALTTLPTLHFPNRLHFPAGLKLISISAGTMAITFTLDGGRVEEP
jgi:hypothetical protein